MSNDMLVRQLEYFIENQGDMQDLKRILSISSDDENFLIELRKRNNNFRQENSEWFKRVFKNSK